MADKRAFALFDVGYFDNPKIAELLDASSIAVSMHLASILYCAQHLTDGFVASRVIQRKLGGTAEDSRLLIENGLWHEHGHDCESCPEVPPGKVYVHDYLEHNRTSDGVKRSSTRAKRAAEARWSKTKGNAVGNATSMQRASGTHSGEQSDGQCSKPDSAMPRIEENRIEENRKDSLAGSRNKSHQSEPKLSARELLQTSSRIINGWAQDRAKIQYPNQMLNELAAQVKVNLEQGIHPEILTRALDRWQDGGYPAKAFYNDIVAVQREQAGIVPGNQQQQPRRATGTDRAAAALVLAEQYRGEESGRLELGGSDVEK